MSPVKLAVEHIVVGVLELGNDLAAAVVYWQHPVARAVGDEDARRADLPGRGHEPGENAITCVKRPPLVIPKESA